MAVAIDDLTVLHRSSSDPADFLGHDNGADVTSRDIVRFEKHLETTPHPRTGKLRHPNTILSYLSSFKGVFTVAVHSILLDETPMDKVGSGTESLRTRRWREPDSNCWSRSCEGLCWTAIPGCRHGKRTRGRSGPAGNGSGAPRHTVPFTVGP
jgi:hypothetical protein